MRQRNTAGPVVASALRIGPICATRARTRVIVTRWSVTYWLDCVRWIGSIEGMWFAELLLVVAALVSWVPVLVMMRTGRL